MWQLLFKAGLLMICVRLDSASADPGPVYVEVDGTAVLPGSADTGNIKTVTWKHGADKAAEFLKGVIQCYGQFRGRCELNILTGAMTINHLTLSDSGFYSVEINGKETNTVQLQVMSPVPKPSVSTWCDPTKTYCLLTCEGNTSAPEADKYRWIEENDWSHSMKVLKITKENKEPEFSCEIKNPVSSSRSDPVQNPFITGGSSVSTVSPILGVILPILLAAAVAVVLYCKRKEGTVCVEVDGTAVLHPGSADTGYIKTVTWKHNGDRAADWYGWNIFFDQQFEDRCELNTRTGKLTINHLTLSDSGRYSVEINGKETNTVQLQVTNGVQPSNRNLRSRVRGWFPRSRTTDSENERVQPVANRSGEAGDEGKPGETTELLSESGGVQQESRGDVNNPPDVSSPAATSSAASSADVHHESAQSPGAAGSSASNTDSVTGDMESNTQDCGASAESCRETAEETSAGHEGPDQDEQPRHEGQEEDEV